LAYCALRFAESAARLFRASTFEAIKLIRAG
jgi:hypothetical protein